MATIIPTKETRPPSISWVKRSQSSSSKQIHIESTNDQQLELTSANHRKNFRAAKYSAQSIRSDGKDEDNLSIKRGVMTPINSTTVTRVKRNRLERLHGEDFTPLNTLHNDRHSNSSRLITNVSKIDEENPASKQKSRRIFPWFDERSCCFIKAIGTFFVLSALAIGIAALVFAIIAYIRSLPTIASTQTTTTTVTTATSICPGGAGFVTVTGGPTLPNECTFYTNISDVTRQAYYQVGGTSCDDILCPVTTWIRFIGSSGSSLANCAVPYRHCGATTTGWYSGLYPSLPGNTVTGYVCYNWETSTCMWNTSISVTNCNGFYVFALSAPPICDARYCTI